MVPKQPFFDFQQRKLFLTLKLQAPFFPQGKTHLSLSFFIAEENFSFFRLSPIGKKTHLSFSFFIAVENISFFSEATLYLSLFSEKLIILMQNLSEI